jgi:FkbM family methyltransferase
MIVKQGRDEFGIMMRLAAFFRLTYNVKQALAVYWFAKRKGSGKGKVVVDRLTGAKMYCPPDGFQILSEAWYNRDYDVTEVPLRPGDLVVDVGANHGYFSCYAASKGAKVLAIEPSSANFAILQKNIALNNWQQQVECRQLAIGATARETVLYRFGRYAGALHAIHPVYAERNSGQPLETLATERVQQHTMAEALEQFGASNIRLLKLDVEGMELEILKSIPVELARDIDCIVMEYHHVYDVKEVYAAASAFGCFEVSLANQLPWAARQIIRLVNKRVWQTIPNFDYDRH